MKDIDKLRFYTTNIDYNDYMVNTWASYYEKICYPDQMKK